MGAIKPHEVLSSTNHEHLAAVAYDIGTAIATRTVDLDALRRSLSQADPKDDFGRGVCAALQEVLFGVITATRHERELSSKRDELRLKPNWIKVLTALQQGMTAPTDIHASTGIIKSSVSRTIRELSAAGYVERIGPGDTNDDEEGDARMRPIRLTLQGIEVATKLPKPDESLDSVVLAKIATLSARLITHRRVQVTVPPNSGVALWLEELQKLAAVRVKPQGRAIEVYNLFDPGPLSSTLYRAAREENPSLLRGLLDAVRGELPVVIRTQVNRDAWGLALKTLPDRDRFTILTEAEIVSGAESVPESPFHLCYDLPQLLLQDRNHSHPRIRALQSESRPTLCLSDRDDGIPLPDAVHPISMVRL
ncbi:MAG: MarR family transcriptional regulator [Sorangiineae bacterium PRO1]|nr:MarR family transcriptional regulator [Sorangiineae bacterium PRO1]